MTSSFDMDRDSRAAFVAAPLRVGGQDFLSLDAATSRRQPDLEERLAQAFEEGRQAGRAELPWQEAEVLARAASALDEALGRVAAQERDWLEATREAALSLALAIAERLVGHAVDTDRDALAVRLDAGLRLVEGSGATELALAPEDHAILVQGQAPELARLVQDHAARLVADDELRPGQARITGGAARTRRVEIDLSATLQHLERELRALLPMATDPRAVTGEASDSAASEPEGAS